MARPNGPSPRQRQRRPFRTRRRFGWGWIRRLPLLWLAALAACAFLTYFFAGSGVFSVKTVRAGSNVSQRQLAQITDHCGCLGDNIFVVRADEIKRRLAAQIPTMVVERVYTRLPNELVVEARPKVGVAVWRTPEAAYAVDSGAEVLQVWKKPFPRGLWKAMPERWQGLPVFDEGYDGQFTRGHRLLIGERIDVDALTYAMDLSAAMPADLQALIHRYSYRRYEGMTLIGKGNWWALFSMRDGVSDINVRADALHLAVFGNESTAPVLAPGGCISLRGPLGDRYQYIRTDHHNCG